MDLQIQLDVDYPVELFSHSMEKIKTIHIKDPYRRGEVAGINFLVYDGSERKLVSFFVPAGIAELTFEKAKSVNNSELKKYSAKYGNIDLNNLGDLNRIGPGLLLKVDDLNENTHVLIWLD